MIDRVKLLLSVKNLTPAQLAETIGVQRSGISHILSGRNKPSLDFVLKVLDAFPDLNEKWLLKGDGEMIIGTQLAKDLFDLEREVTEGQLLKRDEASGDNMLKDEEMAIYKKQVKKESDHVKPLGGLNEVEQVEKSVDQEFPNPKGAKDSRQLQESSVLPKAIPASDKKVTQLIIFYDDDSFKVYHPEK